MSSKASPDQKPNEYDEEEERVVPKDKADRLAEEYENEHHTRAGTKKSNETPSSQSKPKSVR